MLEQTFILNNLAMAENLAKKIANVIVADFVVTLHGDLGVGKTTLTRYILQNMGVEGPIKSPTFTLVEPYHVKNDGNLELAREYTFGNNEMMDSSQIRNDIALYHFDLYRFNDPEEWFYAGFDEYFVKDSICFIEWADKAITLIPRIDWEVVLVMDEGMDYLRILTIKTKTKKGEMCLKQLIRQDEV